MVQGEKAPIVELRVPFVVTGTEEGSANANIVKAKDILVSFNGKPVKYADEILDNVESFKGKLFLQL